ncbi:MAG: hypothetical protein EBY40_06325 [Marivivens sp.]|nr:hypothetical protein [Marivivens sp.]NBT51929.1 hypothetical protein [Marivivens sp.]NCW69836.1 hypothetical protein [Marivivens sp.]NDH02729.1 hypothetical protein [Marivivens sp.]
MGLLLLNDAVLMAWVGKGEKGALPPLGCANSPPGYLLHKGARGIFWRAAALSRRYGVAVRLPFPHLRINVPRLLRGETCIFNTKGSA